MDRRVVLLMGMGVNGINAEGWWPPSETEEQAAEMLADVWRLLHSFDTLIIGRVTFQAWEAYWPPRADDPASSGFQRQFSLYLNQIRKMVCSTTLKSAEWQNSRVVSGDLKAEIGRIKQLPGKNIAVVGGPGIAQSFTQLGLVDDYQLYVHPAIFGSGKSVLGMPENEQHLELVEARQFLSGGIRLHYRLIK